VDDVPVAPEATRDDALGGGDDYELLFAAPDGAAVIDAFAAAAAAPVVIGRCTADPTDRRLGTGPLPEGGWEHHW
jgi:thiamine-monophosphate kinase